MGGKGRGVPRIYLPRIPEKLLLADNEHRKVERQIELIVAITNAWLPLALLPLLLVSVPSHRTRTPLTTILIHSRREQKPSILLDIPSECVVYSLQHLDVVYCTPPMMWEGDNDNGK